VGEDWDAMGEQPAGPPAPALVVLDRETDRHKLRLWPGTPIQRCWWHLLHGLPRPCTDNTANHHVNRFGPTT
jgi:hypothetical protein